MFVLMLLDVLEQPLRADQPEFCQLNAERAGLLVGILAPAADRFFVTLANIRRLIGCQKTASNDLVDNIA